MHQRGPLHSLGERNDVLRPHDIRAQRALQSRVESYIAGRIDNDVDVFRYALSFFFSESEIGLGDVAAHNRNLIADEVVEGGAVTFTHGIERFSGNYVIPEARLR